MTERTDSCDLRVRVVDACDFAALSEALLDDVEGGRAEVYVNRDGRAIARLVPVPYPEGPPWGIYSDVKIADDLDSPLFTDEEVDAFLERELENIYGNSPD